MWMKRYDRIIFISRSNCVRGPMAEAIFQRLDTIGEMQVFSRGLVVLFPEPINPKALLTLENHETPCRKKTSVQFSPKEVTETTLLLTMDERQKDILREEYGIVEHVYTMREYVGEPGDVSDPYGGSLVEYQECYAELSRLVKKILFHISEEETKLAY